MKIYCSHAEDQKPGARAPCDRQHFVFEIKAATPRAIKAKP